MQPNEKSDNKKDGKEGVDGLIRYKRPGGFRALVNSMETTVADKRARLFDTLRKEDPEFIHDVEQCVFNFEEFEQISDLVICEIIMEFKEMRTFALALYKCQNQPLVDKFVKNIPQKQAMQYREESTYLSQVRVSEQQGARFRIIQKARELQQAKRILLKPYNSKYPEAI